MSRLDIKYERIIYLSDYPFLEKVAKLYLRLNFLTSNNTWPGLFNTASNKKRKIKRDKLQDYFRTRLRNIIGENKLYLVEKSHEPKYKNGESKLMVLYKEDK